MGNSVTTKLDAVAPTMHRTLFIEDKKMIKVLLGCMSLALTAAPIASAQTREFGGLTLGVGLSLTHDLGKNDRVNSARVVNGIVRIEDEGNDVVRIMLESHYFFVPDRKFFLNSNVQEKQWGWGPFVAIQPGSDELVKAIGFGVMFGFKRSLDSKDLSSWNIGFGAVVDPSVKVLGEGLQKNQPLPVGETEIRYKNKSQWGALILTSFSF